MVIQLYMYSFRSPFMQLQISVSLNFSKFRSLIGLLATDSELLSVVLTFVNKSLFIVSISLIP
jgi:hypothetical protein